MDTIRGGVGEYPDSRNPVVEKVIRSAVVYLFLLVGFRLADKRQVGMMTAFDLVVLLVISNVVQNALIGNDNSLGGGLLGATVILGLNAIVAWVTFRYKRVERVVEHMPTVLVKHGQILRESALRDAGRGRPPQRDRRPDGGPVKRLDRNGGKHGIHV